MPENLLPHHSETRSRTSMSVYSTESATPTPTPSGTGAQVNGEAGADPGFFAGGVNDGRVQRAPLAPAPTGGLGLINIRLQ